MISVSYRQITFGAYSSFDDFGAYIGSEVDTDTKIERAKPRMLRETIPFMSGSYNFSRLGGKIVYNDRVIRYTFIVSGISRADVEAKIIALDAWLGDVTETELIDTDFPGWKFINVSYNGMNAPQFYSNNETAARVTVEFTAGPYMQSSDGELIDCTNFTPSSAQETYLYDVYDPTSPEALPKTCFWAKMQSAIGASFIVPTGIVVNTYYADVPIDGLTARQWYIFPKVYGGNSFGVGAMENCVVSERTNHWLVRGLDTSIKVRISGATGGDACKSAALSATWYKSFTSRSWLRNTIPDTDSMRIISEGDPTLTKNGSEADISSFAMHAGDIFVVSGVESVACKLQYCSIREQR